MLIKAPVSLSEAGVFDDRGFSKVAKTSEGLSGYFEQSPIFG
jgi:hypothetical protein